MSWKNSFYYELTAPRELSVVPKGIEISARQPVAAETVYTAVSPGTELAAWLGKPPLRPSKIYPRLMGYCNLARVVEIGPDVEGLKVGDFILTHQSHRSSFVCAELEVLWHTAKPDVQFLKKVTSTYLYHLGYSAILSGNFLPGHQVAVVGMGTLGLTVASLLSAFGAKPFLFSNQDFCLAEKYGYPMKKSSFDFSEIRRRVDMEGVDLVINTSNAWEDYRLSLRLARYGGTIISLGFPGRGEPTPEFDTLDTQFFYDKQLTLRYCGYVPDTGAPPQDIRFTLRRNMRYLASLIEEDKLNPFDILNVEASWRQLPSIYEDLSNRRPGMLSAILDWSL